MVQEDIDPAVLDEYKALQESSDMSRANSDFSDIKRLREKATRKPKSMIHQCCKWMVWQRDLKYFNTVALTQNWTNFFAIQMFRL